MGKNQTYTCDKCGHTQDRDRKYADDDKGRWMNTVVLGIKVGHEHVNYSVRFSTQDVVVSALWCDECLGMLGAKRFNRRKANEPEPATPTLEDMVRDIVQQVIEEREP